MPNSRPIAYSYVIPFSDNRARQRQEPMFWWPDDNRQARQAPSSAAPGLAPRPLLSHPRAAARLGWWSFSLGPLMLATTVLLAASWFVTFMTVERLWFWENEVSLYSGLADLWNRGEWLFFVVILVFSMLFPAIKLLAGLYVWARLDAGAAAAKRALGWVQILGKWSMVDVFVVALTVVAINITIVADVDVNAGIYMFCAAVFLSMIEMQLLERIIRRAHPAEADTNAGKDAPI